MRRHLRGKKLSATSRLSTLDEAGWRQRVIPAEVRGFFRRRRTVVHSILLVIFLGLPWVTVDGAPAILIDIPGRHFEFFGQVFLAHDTPLIFFVLGLLVLGIMLVTALWGRVWCGWACPQTVFIDAVYRRLEYWVEGDYLERRRLARAAFSREKGVKLFCKWFLYLLFSSLFAHSFIAYFTGSRRLFEMMNGSPAENWTYFLLVSGVTGLLLFNFGWFREQFCIIMCPYGRFQSVLLDPHSLGIAYDVKRGEPRKGSLPDQSPRGDCVACGRCVQVCPTGIDIRDGLQMECIGCTACVDACDEIMTKVKKPLGLISYAPSVPREKMRLWRPRVLLYSALLLVFALGLIYNLVFRDPFMVAILRATDTPYQVLPQGQVINHFKINLHNQSHREQSFTIALTGATAARVRLVPEPAPQKLAAGESREAHVFVQFASLDLNAAGTLPLYFRIHEQKSEKDVLVPLLAVGPVAKGF